VGWLLFTLAAVFSPGCAVGIVLVIVALCLSGFFAGLLHGPLGEILIFGVTFFAMRTFKGLATGFQKVSEWPYLTEIDLASPEYQMQQDYFLASCVPWEQKFPFALEVKRIYRVDRPGGPPTKASCGEGVRQLFHGTGWESAKAICCDGFRIPSHAGMFGRGLYFADCPTKCWRYCFPSKQVAQLIPKATGRGGLIFACWVDLGQMREEKEAAKHLDGYDRNSWKAWLTRGRGAYDSVKGVEEEEGGALRVPEYVVYRTDQVHLAYLFEVMTCNKR
jgi:hypothetical protein